MFANDTEVGDMVYSKEDIWTVQQDSDRLKT